jgi:hypothetical protein
MRSDRRLSLCFRSARISGRAKLCLAERGGKSRTRSSAVYSYPSSPLYSNREAGWIITIDPRPRPPMERPTPRSIVRRIPSLRCMTGVGSLSLSTIRGVGRSIGDPTPAPPQQPQAQPPSDPFRAYYAGRLRELTFNSRPIIQDLSLIAMQLKGSDGGWACGCCGGAGVG